MQNQVVEKCQRDLFIIDGVAPFFAPFADGSRQNWSKAPLSRLQKHGTIPEDLSQRVCHELDQYCRAVSAIGYNAITFDDLAHLTLFDFYPYLLSRTVHSYQKLFKKVFAIAKKYGLQIFVTTDLMFFNDHIATHVKGRKSDQRLRALFVEAVERLYDLFPEVDGIVTRIGEADGHDVDSLFISELQIRTPKQCNQWLKDILQSCEYHHKQLIFRTWGLGAYRIGDLIWNEKTERSAFWGINSANFIVSRKFGGADFFRFLPLSDRILNSSQPQIIELQARREYEGFGTFPAYVGRQYEQFRDELQECSSLRGICVWCQTGGWSHFDRLSFLQTSSPWNELNAISAYQLFSSNQSAQQILSAFCQQRWPQVDQKQLLELVNLCDQLIDELWYFKPFAEKSLWFRRLRVPPLLWIFWDTIIVNRALRLVVRTYVDEPGAVKERDRQQREQIRRLRVLINNVGVEREGLLLGADTLRMLYTLRRFYLGKGGAKREKKIHARLEKYRHKHPQGFLVECDFAPFHIRWVTAGLLFGLLLRQRARYRWFDRLVLVPMTGWMYPLLKRWQRHRIPELAERQALGLELFFR